MMNNERSTLSRRDGRARIAWTAAGVLVLCAAWEAISRIGDGVFIAGPLAAAHALGTIVRTPDFRRHFFVTVLRIGGGVGIGAVVGAMLGLAAGIRREIGWLLEPFRWVLMSVPAVVLVVVAMLLFGLGSHMVIAITAALVAPVVYVNTFAGMSMVDQGILAMARVYRFPLWMRVRDVYGPAVAASLLSGLVLAVGMGVRVVILAEVLGAGEGIGHALTWSRTVLDIPVLTAWVIVCVLIVGLAEYLFLRPVERWVTRWRQ